MLGIIFISAAVLTLPTPSYVTNMGKLAKAHGYFGDPLPNVNVSFKPTAPKV